MERPKPELDSLARVILGFLKNRGQPTAVKLIVAALMRQSKSVYAKKVDRVKDRLRRLEAAGLVERVGFQKTPRRPYGAKPVLWEAKR